jgi:hypothetical protein
MLGYRLALWIGALVSALLVSTGLGHAQERRPASSPTDTQAFKDYINNRPTFREHHTWGIFLGTGWNNDNIDQIETWQKAGTWVDPFTGHPFHDAKVFVFGQTNPLLEGVRIVSDHVEIHVLSSWDDLQGQHFDFVLCHSNGCTNALGAQRDGVMQADHVFALGTDWTLKYFQPGDLRGTALTFFTMPSDPIWKIPAPNWKRITEDTPGLSFTIPFGDTPGAGQAEFPVIRLKVPAERQGTLTKPFQAHALVEAYFQGVRQWMHTAGPQQQAITEQLRQVDTSSRDERKQFVPASSGQRTPFLGGCPPECDGGGGPGGPGHGPQGGGQGPLRSTPTQDPRGGIAIDIHLTPDDFRVR